MAEVCTRAPAERPLSVAPAAPGLARFVLLTALGVGVLAGLCEACWPYLLPALGRQWQAALPSSPTALLSFLAAAIATDGLLVLGCGLLALALLSVAARYSRRSVRPQSLRLLARAAILGGTACYLFNGWLAMTVLSEGDQLTRFHGLLTGVGTIVLLMLAMAVSSALNVAQQRWRRVTPTAVWCVCVAVLLAVTAPAFHSYRNSLGPPVQLPPAGNGPRPNIVLVTIDTLRADYAGCYGNSWVKTPTLDQLADHSVVFDAAISQAPSTTPSHCSIMTSVYPVEHGAENGWPMKPTLITLADMLSSAGYETTAFASATTTRSINTGLQKGFDRYVDSLVWWSELFGRDEFQHLILFYLAGFTQDTQISGEIVTDRALRWLANRSEKPFFTWLHYFDPHEPYGSAPPFENMYRGRVADGLPMPRERERYAEDITSADFQLGRFLDELRRVGLYENTLIIVTSDHGEAFGEQHAHVTEVGHGSYLSDVTQRVPLLIKLPGAPQPARRVGEQIELTDLAPTVLHLLNLEPPAQFRGRSFASLLDGRSPQYVEDYARAFATVYLEKSETNDETLFLQQLAVRTNQWKYITRPRLNEAELYDLLQDPHERTSIASENHEVAGKLHAQIMPFWAPEHDASEDLREGIAPALARQLQALGYLGGSDED